MFYYSITVSTSCQPVFVSNFCDPTIVLLFALLAKWGTDGNTLLACDLLHFGIFKIAPSVGSLLTLSQAGAPFRHRQGVKFMSIPWIHSSTDILESIRTLLVRVFGFNVSTFLDTLAFGAVLLLSASHSVTHSLHCVYACTIGKSVLWCVFQSILTLTPLRVNLPSVYFGSIFKRYYPAHAVWCTLQTNKANRVTIALLACKNVW